MARNNNVESTLSKYLVARVGQTVIINEITEETGLRDEQIRAVVRRLISQNKMHIEVVSRGHVWRVVSSSPNPVPPIKKELPPLVDLNEPVPQHERDERGIPDLPVDVPTESYQRIGTTQDGTAIVRDENGNLFKLVRL